MDQIALDQALARFDGFWKNLPPTKTEDVVKKYHAIVDALSLATGDTLDNFKIADNEIDYKVVGAQRTSFSGRPGRVIRSTEKRCDYLHFKSQIDGLSHYLESRGFRRTSTSASAKAQRAGHSIHVENMFGSAIQQGAVNAQVTIHLNVQSADFKALIQDIKARIPALGLDPARTQELASDVTTIETQIASPVPKRSIITECLSSIRTILEGAAGSALASGILHEIAKYFP